MYLPPILSVEVEVLDVNVVARLGEVAVEAVFAEGEGGDTEADFPDGAVITADLASVVMNHASALLFHALAASSRVSYMLCNSMPH